MTREHAEWKLTVHGYPDNFPGFLEMLRAENGGKYPDTVDGSTLLDEMAAAFGLRITADRRGYIKRPVFATADALLAKDITPPPFTVEGLLPAGLCILSAPSKTGKSWLSVALCEAVATGSPFWGRRTTQGDALYLDLEGSEWALQGRMKKMGVVPSEHFQYHFSAPPMDGGFTEFIDEWRESVQSPRLIVIDVVQRVKPINKGRGNAYESDYQLFPKLNDYAVQHGIAIIAVTHNKKSSVPLADDYEAISGSVAQMAAAATTWLIKGKRGQSEDKTFMATGRLIREVEDSISFNANTCRWENNGDVTSAAETKAAREYATNPIRKTLLALIEEEHGCWRGSYADLWEEIAEKTGEYPFATARELATGIRPMLTLLAQQDNIQHMKDKHKSGQHKFYIPR